MKYCKGSKIIEASEKAYRLIYKDQGFEPYVEGVTNEVDVNKLTEAMEEMVEEALKKKKFKLKVIKMKKHQKRVINLIRRMKRMEQINQNKIKEIVLLDLKCSQLEVDEAIVDLEIEKAKIDICTYCNIEVIPPGLINVVANLAFDYIKSRVQSTNNADDKEIKSIQEGDTTINFNTSSTNIKSKESIFNSYLSTLNDFRGIKF